MDSHAKYVEVASGSVSNRGKVMQLSELHDFIKKAGNDQEIYHSYYCFDYNLKTHIDKTRTIQNYKGAYQLNQIILDFDLGSLTEPQLLDWLKHFISDEFVNNLQIPDDYYTIWYSGTGFHIHLANCFDFKSDVHLPGIVKTTMGNLFPDADNIFDGARLIRAGNTINSKSNLYKTQINRDDLFQFTMEEIKEISSSTDTSSPHGLWFDPDITIEPLLSHLVKKPRAITSPSPITKNKIKTDYSSIVTCMQKAYKAGPVHGQRNETMVRLASWMKRNGIPREITELGLRNWSKLDQESANVTNSIYSENFGAIGCEDPIMSQWCDPKCIYYKNKDYSIKILTAKELERQYRNWLKQDFKDRSFDLSDIWPINKSISILPGELVIVLGDTGLGKTAFVQNLVAKLPNMSCLFLSLEVQGRPFFRRLSQITHSLDKNAIDDTCSLPEESSFSSQFQHINVIDEAIELKQLEKTVAETRPKLLVVDTTDEILVNGVYNDFERMNNIIVGLKRIANSLDVIIIAVHHINKESAKNNETRLHSAKGSSTVVQKADKVLVINGNRDELIRYVWTEKSRDTGNFKLQFEFHPKTFKWEFIPR